MHYREYARLAIAAAITTSIVGWRAESADAPPMPATAPTPAPVDKAERDEVILDRQLIMQQLEKDADAFGDVLAGLKPQDDLTKYARALAKGAQESHDAFAVNLPGGSSKPEAWTNWPDFSSRMDHFVAATEKLAKAAETPSPDMGVIGQLAVEALPCKQCHDVYRKAKTPKAGSL